MSNYWKMVNPEPGQRPKMENFGKCFSKNSILNLWEGSEHVMGFKYVRILNAFLALTTPALSEHQTHQHWPLLALFFKFSESNFHRHTYNTSPFNAISQKNTIYGRHNKDQGIPKLLQIWQGCQDAIMEVFWILHDWVCQVSVYENFSQGSEYDCIWLNKFPMARFWICLVNILQGFE